jgi:hypothetical protein
MADHQSIRSERDRPATQNHVFLVLENCCRELLQYIYIADVVV